MHHSSQFNAIKEQILVSMLEHAAFDGWSNASFARALEETGVPKALAHEAFPAGAVDVITYHSAKADGLLANALQNNPDFLNQKIRMRIFTAVMTRLDAHTREREAIARAVGVLSMPWNAARSLKALYATVDTMWRCAGDTSTDYNFYTKRIILGNVYSLTLRVWLHDESDNFEETRAFLHRRIENVMQFEKAKAGCKKQFTSLSEFFSPSA